MLDTVILGHHSVGQALAAIKITDPGCHAAILVMLQVLNLDPEAASLDDIEVKPLKEYRDNPLIPTEVLQAKYHIWKDRDISTHYRVVFIREPALDVNIYLWLDYKAQINDTYYTWGSDINNRLFCYFHDGARDRYLEGDIEFIWKTD